MRRVCELHFKRVEFPRCSPVLRCVKNGTCGNCRVSGLVCLKFYIIYYNDNTIVTSTVSEIVFRNRGVALDFTYKIK